MYVNMYFVWLYMSAFTPGCPAWGAHGLRESVNSGLDYWTGLLDWTTGLTFYLEKRGKIVKKKHSMCV